MAGISADASLIGALSVMALDFGIFQINLPSTADVRSADPHNPAIDQSRKVATWTAISACTALSVAAKEVNIAIFGVGFAVALDWYYRHANAVHPASGKVTVPPAAGQPPAGVGG